MQDGHLQSYCSMQGMMCCDFVVLELARAEGLRELRGFEKCDAADPNV